MCQDFGRKQPPWQAPRETGRLVQEQGTAVWDHSWSAQSDIINLKGRCSCINFTSILALEKEQAPAVEVCQEDSFWVWQHEVCTQRSKKQLFSYVRMLFNSFSHQPVCTSMACGKTQQNHNVNNYEVLGQCLLLCYSPWRLKLARPCEPLPLQTCNHSCSSWVSWHSVSSLPLFCQKYTKCSRYPTESKMRLYPHLG